MKAESIRINSKRLNDRIQEMAQFGALASGGVKRLTLSPQDKAARDLFKQWMEELGLEIAIDEIGNMFGILKAKMLIDVSELVLIWTACQPEEDMMAQ